MEHSELNKRFCDDLHARICVWVLFRLDFLLYTTNRSKLRTHSTSNTLFSTFNYNTKYVRINGKIKNFRYDFRIKLIVIPLWYAGTCNDCWSSKTICLRFVLTLVFTTIIMWIVQSEKWVPHTTSRVRKIHYTRIVIKDSFCGHDKTEQNLLCDPRRQRFSSIKCVTYF